MIIGTKRKAKTGEISQDEFDSWGFSDYAHIGFASLNPYNWGKTVAQLDQVKDIREGVADDQNKELEEDQTNALSELDESRLKRYGALYTGGSVADKYYK